MSGGGQMMRYASLLFGLALAACNEERATYHLYRSSVVEGVGPMFLASFNAREGGGYNRENCLIAAGLFQNQPGVVVKAVPRRSGGVARGRLDLSKKRVVAARLLRRFLVFRFHSSSFFNDHLDLDATRLLEERVSGNVSYSRSGSRRPQSRPVALAYRRDLSGPLSSRDIWARRLTSGCGIRRAAC